MRSVIAFLVASVVALVGVAGVAGLGAGGAPWPFTGEDRRPDPPGRVLLVGDSLLHQSRPQIDRGFDEAGVATGWLGGSGEGLLTRQGDWLDQIDRAVETFDPDAVVIEACCNYAQHDDAERYVTAGGTPVERDSELMYQLWEQAARDAVVRAAAGGAEVYVVIAPQPVDDTFFSLMVGARMERFATIWREVADDHPELHVIDWSPAFTDGGEPVTVLPEVGRVRHDDGLHVVGAGHDLVASITASAVLGSG